MLFKNLKWKRAIYKGDINNVERILADGIDINEWIDGKTPLELAISRGHKHIMEFLLRNGASQEDLIISYYDYCDVLHLTVIHNKIDLINPVIEYTGRLNPQIRSNHEAIDGLTPLLLSLKIMKNFARENRENEAKGYEDIALRLIELGADLKIIAKNRVFPLHYSVNVRSIKVTSAILNNGFDINTPDKNGRNATFHTINLDILKYLIKNGADINQRDNEGLTLLEYCENRNNMLPFETYNEKIEFLKANGAIR